MLVLQFRSNAVGRRQEQVCIRRAIESYGEVLFVDVLQDRVDWNDPATLLAAHHGVILGGSGDFDFDGNRLVDDVSRRASYEFLDRLQPLLQYLFAYDVPTLGICYGHQLLGAFAGVAVRYDAKQQKSCSHVLRLAVESDAYELLRGMPSVFHAHYGHKDVLTEVPEGATVLMNGGDRCQIPALSYTNYIYSVQFHPELTYGDMVERLKHSPGYLPEGVEVEDVYQDDSRSQLLLRNFARLATAQAPSYY